MSSTVEVIIFSDVHKKYEGMENDIYLQRTP